MNILILGGTGFIGRPTIAKLQGRGDQVHCLVRDLDKARGLLGEGIVLLDLDLPLGELRKEIEFADVIINLAGEPLAGVRWNKGKKKRFHQSRIGLNELITENIAYCDNPPDLFISASAVGIYGDRGDELLTEDSLLDTGDISKLCIDWENSAIKAKEYGVRVCTLRFGIILGREGGVLKQVMPSFELGIGSYVGDSEQSVPWIHILDVIRAIEFCIDTNIEGNINVVAPEASTSKKFANILGDITNTKIILHIPFAILRLIFASGAKILTNSLNVVPEKLLENNFKFQYKSLREALIEEVDSQSVQVSRTSRVIDHLSNQGQYELSTTVELNSSAEETFNFFASPLNLGLTTPAWLGFKIIEMPDTLNKGSKILYKIKLGPIYIKWCTLIAEWEPSHLFVDFQFQGPYSLWWHEHRVKTLSKNSSIIEDNVTYKVPFGIFGRIAHYFFIRKTLNRIFNYRRFIMKLRFG